MHPDPTVTEPAVLAEWIVDNAPFKLTVEELCLVSQVTEGMYTGEPNNVYALYELRILFWQVVGAKRNR